MTSTSPTTTPTVVIGAGLAGLCTALTLSQHPVKLPVKLIVAHPLGHGCSSSWAQGGLAAAVGADDSAALHAQDTLKAGGTLCDTHIVEQTTGDGADVIAQLIKLGARFDHDDNGALRLGLEGAHSRRRIVHASDSTGNVIMQALTHAVHTTPSIELVTNATAVRLITENGRITGVEIDHAGKREIITTDKVVLATGGCAALWQHTTNPLGNWGHGLALAARAGAVLSDLEFMQFHPTAIDIGRDPMPLASEALRGEGALLVNEVGERFMASFARGELEPRDVVARAIWQQHQNGHKTFLDVRPLGTKFSNQFPAIAHLCQHAGLDPAKNPIPIAPAAHYHMGGVKTDAHGRTSIGGLWACGEVAATGLHGANRLASNSLLEAASFGMRVAQDIAANGAHKVVPQIHAQPTNTHRDHTPLITAQEIRAIMTSYVGVLRDKAGLLEAISLLRPLAAASDMALVGLMIATAALNRAESRGSHTRTDYPALSPAWEHRQDLTLNDLPLKEIAA